MSKIQLTLGEKYLLTIDENGKVELDPSYTADQIALMFWEKVGRRFAEYDLIYRHMESVLSRVGQADITGESLKKELENAEDPMQANVLVESFQRNQRDLEKLVGEAIELGRGLAKRPMPINQPPTKLPDFVTRDEDNEYRGKTELNRNLN